MVDDFLSRRRDKQKTTRAKSNKDEKRAAMKFGARQTKNSGAGLIKGDNISPIQVGECKTTGKKQITIHRVDLEKVMLLGARGGKLPYLTMSFRGSDKHYVVVRDRDFALLLNAARAGGKR